MDEGTENTETLDLNGLFQCFQTFSASVIQPPATPRFRKPELQQPETRIMVSGRNENRCR